MVSRSKEVVELAPDVIKSEAKKAGIVLIEDSKFGRVGFVSVQCSWPQLIDFARRMAKLGSGR